MIFRVLLLVCFAVVPAAAQVAAPKGKAAPKTAAKSTAAVELDATVVETGLYNLTKQEAPCLIHYGADRTEQWLLVRLD